MSDKSPISQVRKRSSIKYTKKPAYRRKKAGQSENGWVETLILQCIVSGIVLSAAMLLCIVKTPFTQNLRNDLHAAVTGSMNADKPMEDITGIASNISSQFKSFFGKDKPAEEEVVPAFYTNEQDFRIDEDILESMYANPPNGLDNEIKNWEAPQD